MWMRDEGRERRGDKRVKCVNVQQEGKARRVFGGCALREGVKNPTAGASGPSGIWHLAFGQPAGQSMGFVLPVHSVRAYAR